MIEEARRNKHINGYEGQEAFLTFLEKRGTIGRFRDQEESMGIQLGTAAYESKLLQSIYPVFQLPKRPGQAPTPGANPDAAGISDILSGGQNV